MQPSYSTDDEQLAIVDERDRVIGCASRRLIHEQGLRHRAVHIVLLNSANEIFVQQRSPLKDVDPGLWDTSAAGHVDYGESYADCAARELEEELGIRDTPLERVDEIVASIDTGNEFVQVYRAVSDQSIVLNLQEISAGRWYTTDELKLAMAAETVQFTAAFRLIFERFHAKFYA